MAAKDQILPLRFLRQNLVTAKRKTGNPLRRKELPEIFVFRGKEIFSVKGTFVYPVRLTACIAPSHGDMVSVNSNRT